MTRVRDNGTVFLRGIRFRVNRTLSGTLAYLVETESPLAVFDDQGTLLIEHPWPEPNTSAAANREGHEDHAKVPECY